MTDGYGIPPARVSTGANRHDSLLLAPTPDRLADLGPLPDAHHPPRLAERLPPPRPLPRRRPLIIDAYFDLADTIITVRASSADPGRPTAGRPIRTAAPDDRRLLDPYCVSSRFSA